MPTLGVRKQHIYYYLFSESCTEIKQDLLLVFFLITDDDGKVLNLVNPSPDLLGLVFICLCMKELAEFLSLVGKRFSSVNGEGIKFVKKQNSEKIFRNHDEVADNEF